MKKLLLLSSMLFLGSCGNSDKTFKITNVAVTSSATKATLTLNTAIKVAAISAPGITLTYTNTVTADSSVHNCKITGLTVIAGTEALTTVALNGGTSAIADVATNPVSTQAGCQAVGIISKAAIAEGLVTGTDASSDKYSNEVLANVAGTVAA